MGVFAQISEQVGIECTRNVADDLVHRSSGDVIGELKRQFRESLWVFLRSRSEGLAGKLVGTADCNIPNPVWIPRSYVS